MKGHYPVNHDGDMLEYAYSDDCSYVKQWVPMNKFKATLKFIRTEQGRSSFRLICKDVESGRKYSVMYNCCDEFISKTINGCVTDTWEVVKRGAYYGVVFAQGDMDE